LLWVRAWRPALAWLARPLGLGWATSALWPDAYDRPPPSRLWPWATNTAWSCSFFFGFCYFLNIPEIKANV
jgi:hypothetical protein